MTGGEAFELQLRQAGQEKRRALRLRAIEDLVQLLDGLALAEDGLFEADALGALKVEGDSESAMIGWWLWPIPTREAATKSTG